MNKTYDYDNEIRTPSGKEFNPTMAKSINRRYVFSIKDKQLTASTEYTIGGRCYKVNSIFDLLNTSNCEEGLKRLMINEANKAS